MRSEKVRIELTNMVMVEDKSTGKVLVQERLKSWTGLSFPGGHVEAGESFVDSAVREVKEETGLDIRNLKTCGVIHWIHRTRKDRYIVFLYKTNDFSGTLLDATDEGRVFWIDPDELKNEKLSTNFANYLPMFFSDEYSEALGEWSEDEPDVLIYK
ncbi:MAG: 8-oxo-dGTP diphosphatase [Clostridia bacterium]|nr:8-oxo-dGTP diphosphatase [Clostridia bacterium]